MYKNGSDAEKRAIADVAIEHLFEKEDVETYFGEWLGDSVLVVAYPEA